MFTIMIIWLGCVGIEYDVFNMKYTFVMYVTRQLGLTTSWHRGAGAEGGAGDVGGDDEAAYIVLYNIYNLLYNILFKAPGRGGRGGRR